MLETVDPVADAFVLMRSAWSLQAGKQYKNSGATHVVSLSNVLVRDGVVCDGDTRDGHPGADGTLFQVII